MIECNTLVVTWATKMHATTSAAATAADLNPIVSCLHISWVPNISRSERASEPTRDEGERNAEAHTNEITNASMNLYLKYCSGGGALQQLISPQNNE